MAEEGIFFFERENLQGYVEPCKFGEGQGFYDNYGELSFDMMFHGFDYPDEIGKDEFWAGGLAAKNDRRDCEVHPPGGMQPNVKKVYKADESEPTEASVGYEEVGLLEGYEERRL